MITKPASSRSEMTLLAVPMDDRSASAMSASSILGVLLSWRTVRSPVLGCSNDGGATDRLARDGVTDQAAAWTSAGETDAPGPE
ncbi:hypothetical protein A3862_04620 [Methylobacterium sp. XJLW]|nr:hypothetical protein A3862_04620 [Methylobacterium sp. XJLW]